MRQILLGIERERAFYTVVVALAAPSVGIVTGKEEVFVEVCRRLCTQSAAPPVHEVACEDGVDGTDVDVVWRTGLHGVFKQRFQSEDNILDALDIFDVMYELVHRAFALRQLHLPVLLPEVNVTHLRVGLCHLLLDASEQLLGYRVEGVVVQSGCTADDDATHETQQAQLCYHVVLCEHPLAVGHTLILLLHLHVLHEVDVTLLRDGELALSDVQRGVVQDIQVTPEPHIVLVVGQEVQVNTTVTGHHYGVLNVVAVEADALVGERRYERVL